MFDKPGLHGWRVLAATMPLLLAGCGSSAPDPDDGFGGTAATSRAPSSGSESSSGGAPPVSSIKDLHPAAECPDPGPDAKTVAAAAAAATVPLKVGLTLSHIWKAYEGDYEHECLDQVIAIDERSILTQGSCPVGEERKALVTQRRICWKDFMDSYLYIPGDAEKFPDTFVGALHFSASLSSLKSLKDRGEMHHRFVEMSNSDPLTVTDGIDGTLTSDGAGTFNLIINDRLAEVPTIEASYFNHANNDIVRVKILDDARFPLMLDHYVPSEKGFFITYTKVSFPTDNGVERRLAQDSRADVYGIFFGFASDDLRPESEPVLREIAGALQAHPDWKLRVDGHTDGIGSDAQNLELSRRRSAAVKAALVNRFDIDSGRLSTGGYGASEPRAPNDTAQGRARNRRVELQRL